MNESESECEKRFCASCAVHFEEVGRTSQQQACGRETDHQRQNSQCYSHADCHLFEASVQDADDEGTLIGTLLLGCSLYRRACCCCVSVQCFSHILLFEKRLAFPPPHNDGCGFPAYLPLSFVLYYNAA